MCAKLLLLCPTLQPYGLLLTRPSVQDSPDKYTGVGLLCVSPSGYLPELWIEPVTPITPPALQADSLLLELQQGSPINAQHC